MIIFACPLDNLIHFTIDINGLKVILFWNSSGPRSCEFLFFGSGNGWWALGFDVLLLGDGKALSRWTKAPTSQAAWPISFNLSYLFFLLLILNFFQKWLGRPKGHGVTFGKCRWRLIGCLSANGTNFPASALLMCTEPARYQQRTYRSLPIHSWIRVNEMARDALGTASH